MTETPEFSGGPELFTRQGFRALVESEIANELMWVVSELVDRIQE